MAFISLIMASTLLIALLIISIIGLLINITGIVFIVVHLIRKRKKKSKAFFISAIIMFCISVPMIGIFPGFLAITQYASTPPKEITVDNIVYRNGFYGNLWTVNLTYKGDDIEVEGNKFRRVDCEQFD